MDSLVVKSDDELYTFFLRMSSSGNTTAKVKTPDGDYAWRLMKLVVISPLLVRVRAGPGMAFQKTVKKTPTNLRES